MKKEEIIELDDNNTYMLLDETVIEGNKYFFAVKLENVTLEPTTKYEVFLEEKEDGEIFMSALDESDFKQAVLIDFTNNYMNKVGKMITDKE